MFYNDTIPIGVMYLRYVIIKIKIHTLCFQLQPYQRIKAM